MNTLLPKVRKRPRMMPLRDDAPIRCPSHLAWLRLRECAIAGRTRWYYKLIDGILKLFGERHVCSGRIEAAHVRMGTDGSLGVKPSDSLGIPLCSGAHHYQHQIGEAEFERAYGVSMRAIAGALWELSPHGRKFRLNLAQRSAGEST